MKIDILNDIVVPAIVLGSVAFIVVCFVGLVFIFDIAKQDKKMYQWTKDRYGKDQ